MPSRACGSLAVELVRQTRYPIDRGHEFVGSDRVSKGLLPPRRERGFKLGAETLEMHGLLTPNDVGDKEAEGAGRVARDDRPSSE